MYFENSTEKDISYLKCDTQQKKRNMTYFNSKKRNVVTSRRKLLKFPTI